VAVTTVAYNCLTSKERRHTLQIGVSIGVHGRRVPSLIVLLSVLDGRVLMAVRQESVPLVDIVVIQFQLHFQLDVDMLRALLHSWCQKCSI
jgi:hypothetical protein